MRKYLVLLTAMIALVPIDGRALVNHAQGIEDGRAEITMVGIQGARDILMARAIVESPAATEIFTKSQWIGNELIEDDPEAFVSIGRFEPVAVRTLVNGDVEIHLLNAEEQAHEMPDRIVVSREEFERVGFEFLEPGDQKLLAENYSVFEETKEAARNGTRKRARMRYGGYKGCLAYVCKRIGCSGRIGNAVGMTRWLKRNKSWKSVSCQSPRNGDVASWSGGSHGAGHTAIWAGGWCYDQGCFDPGRKYSLKECVRRP